MAVSDVVIISSCMHAESNTVYEMKQHIHRRRFIEFFRAVAEGGGLRRRCANVHRQLWVFWTEVGISRATKPPLFSVGSWGLASKKVYK